MNSPEPKPDDTPVSKPWLPHVIHVLALAVPALILSPWYGWNLWIAVFVCLIGLAGYVESVNVVAPDQNNHHRKLFLRKTRPSQPPPGQPCSNCDSDPLAIQIASIVGFLLLMTFWAAQIESLVLERSSLPIQWLGCMLSIIGIALRVTAIRTLGVAFVSDIRVTGSVIRSGIYRWLNHPGEVGMLLFVLGASMILNAWLTASIAAIVLVPISVWRIRRENEALDQAAELAVESNG